jgi:outer membrane protein assembly factor BamB
MRTYCCRLGVGIFLLLGQLAMAADWLTFGHDPQRTGWATEETKLTPQTVGNLELQWTASLENASLALSALTAPLVAENVNTSSGPKTLVYVAGSSNQLFAVDADTGKTVWQRKFQSYVNAKAESFYLCPNAVNATPVIDRSQNLIFALGSDGRLLGLDLGTGDVRFGPFQFIPPFAKPWSLNLWNGFVYTTTSQNCGGDRSGLYSMQVSAPGHQTIFETLVRNGSGAGAWDRGGSAISPEGQLFVTTGDGLYRPETSDYGSSFLAASTPELKITDHYSPLNRVEINKRDLDLPSGGLSWFAYRDYRLLVGGGKESAVYLLNADELGGKDHYTPLDVSLVVGNEGKVLEEKGLWGSPAVWRDETGQPWVYVTLWGEPSKAALREAKSNGAAQHGSVMAFKVELQGPSEKPCLHLMWISPDVNLPDAPAVANGVLFVVATGENPRQDKMLGKTDFKSEAEWKNNLLTTEERGIDTKPAELMALDAKSGKLLYRSGTSMKTWNHFGGIAIANGRIYAVDHSSTLYSFGLRKQ